MIHCLWPLLILATDASAHTASPLTHAQEVRHWDFEADDDRNYDRWPDDWTRRRGKGYPLYVGVEIAADQRPSAGGETDTPGDQHALRMELDGGAALVYSPLIEVSPLFSYLLKGSVKTAGLQHHAAYAAVMFYDQDRKLIQTIESRRHTQSSDWTPFHIGPAIPASNQVRWAVIALHLEPTAKADLFGSAMFDDLWFAKLPRVYVKTNRRHNLYTSFSDVEITCQASGFSQPNPTVRFELQDVHGTTLATHEMAMQSDRSEAHSNRVFAGAATWQPPIREFGFYRVLVSMGEPTSNPIITNIAVLQPFPKTSRGEFGWTLPNGDAQVTLKDLLSLLEEVGIHWVKFPVWYDGQDTGRAEELAWFAERLSARTINVVGMLDEPPPSVRELFGKRSRLFGDESKLRVAEVFVEPEVWHPAVDPVMTRLSLKIQWWQLGGDQDTSFVNFPNLEKTIGGILDGFNRFGQHVSLGISWRAIDESPVSKTPPWSFLSYAATPALTAEEMSQYISNEPSTSARRWLIMEPLSKSHYSLETRARDLVRRMVAAKMEQVDGVFVPDPFDAEHGLMTPGGEPDKMLLPWRTAAMMLADANYLGSIRLPNGSPNRIFQRGDEAVMVVWNDQPTDEVVYLGERVHQIDVWGSKRRVRDLQADGFTRQEIKVTNLPTFVTGVDPQIAQWRMQFQFDDHKIASVFGQEQTVGYSFGNPFGQGVGGTMKLIVPSVWAASPRSANFKLAAHEAYQRGFRVTLQPSASSGEQPIRADFEITASRNYKFSIYRTLEVGVGDILVDLSSRMDEHGNLIIEQQLTNTTDQFVSFNCNLTTTKRRRERRQIFNRGQGTTTVLFVYPHGEELLGETMWLRVEEIDGLRILNHQIVAHE